MYNFSLSAISVFLFSSIYKIDLILKVDRFGVFIKFLMYMNNCVKKE